MAQSSFPIPVSDVRATAVEIFRHQKKSEIAEALESASARFDEVNYDNWNGGTYSWALRFEVPVAIYSSIEPRLEGIEKEIKDRLSYLNRLHTNDHLSEVTITPISENAHVLGQQVAPSEFEVHRLWPEERFRLFLSHVAKYKIGVSRLKDELAIRGVAAFVAHEDIEPSREWQREIELALRSMHAMAALVTPDFHESTWTDQEVGWAFGRGLLVLPVRLGANPYGFAGKVQGISGTLDNAAALAAALVNALLINPQTHVEMRRSLVTAFGAVASCDMARAMCHHLPRVTDFTKEETEVLWKACAENPHIMNAKEVVSAIYRQFGAPPEQRKTSETAEDDLPF